MPDGRYFLNDMEFEQYIKELSDRDLLEFTSRQTYDIFILSGDNKKRIGKLEAQSNKRSGIIGGGGAMIGAAVAAVIDYFVRRG